MDLVVTITDLGLTRGLYLLTEVDHEDNISGIIQAYIDVLSSRVTNKRDIAFKLFTYVENRRMLSHRSSFFAGHWQSNRQVPMLFAQRAGHWICTHKTKVMYCWILNA